MYKRLLFAALLALNIEACCPNKGGLAQTDAAGSGNDAPETGAQDQNANGKAGKQIIFRHPPKHLDENRNTIVHSSNK